MGRGGNKSLKLFMYMNYRLNLVTASVCTSITQSDRITVNFKDASLKRAALCKGLERCIQAPESIFDMPAFTYLAEHCSCDASSAHVKLVPEYVKRNNEEIQFPIRAQSQLAGTEQH